MSAHKFLFLPQLDVIVKLLCFVESLLANLYFSYGTSSAIHELSIQHDPLVRLVKEYSRSYFVLPNCCKCFRLFQTESHNLVLSAVARV